MVQQIERVEGCLPGADIAHTDKQKSGLIGLNGRSNDLGRKNGSVTSLYLGEFRRKLGVCRLTERLPNRGPLRNAFQHALLHLGIADKP